MLKRLSPRTIFSLTPSSIFIAKCSTASPSHLTDPYSHSHPDSRNVRVSVWWDVDSCPVPLGANAYRVPEYIQTHLKSNGIRGPIGIKGFTDMLKLRTNPWVFSSTAVDLTDIKQGESLNQALTAWASKNPAPFHVFVITAEGSSKTILDRLSLDNYNVLLATKESAPADLSSAAKMVWSWDTLMNGGKVPSKSVAAVFTQESFWIDVHTFITSDIGNFILSVSNTRVIMAAYLKERGPADVRSLDLHDVHILVDLLISEKKWVLETPWEMNPFRLNSC